MKLKVAAALFAVSMASGAVELRTSDAEKKQCEAMGGCIVLTMQNYQRQVQDAYQLGFHDGLIATLKPGF